MADEETAKPLVSIGAWLSLIILLIMFCVIRFLALISIPWISDIML